ncbi:MAG TPA: penicillin-binding protein 2 [Acidimicrobiales bacterium]|nr:penicillin-binding protein 2 [Acidimicrobiales bacterium]
MSPRLRRAGPSGRGSGRLGDPRYRALGLLVLFGLLFAVVLVRLGYVQVVGAQQYVAYGEDQRIEPISLPAARGTIFDRNGQDLALSVPTRSIGADPSVVPDSGRAASDLADALELPPKDVAAKLATDGHFVYLARQVDDERAERVEALDIPGVLVFDESARLRPAGALAHALLGTVDIDNVGVSGLELRYDERLSGDPGEYVVERDLEGRTIPGGRHVVDPSEPGDDLMLTIDRGLQYATEAILAEQVRAVGAKGGWAIVSDPRTGEVLTMANVEADPKTGRVGDTGDNRAVTTMYEPGSVNKIITMAAALEEGAVTPDTVLDVPSSLLVGDHTYSDASSLPPRLSANQILALSSNIGTIEIAQRLGMETLDEYLRRFGFGKQTALGLPHEVPGLLVEPEDWSGTSIGSIPLGQGISVTAMQMLHAFNTIANNGVYVPPTLLRATFDAEGERHDVAPGEGQRVVSPTTAQQVREMLAQAVAYGTAEDAAIDGYEVAGKTGTARKPQPGGGYEDANGNVHYAATFAGFIPADDPQVSIIVVIDEPGTSPFAGRVAAPAFAAIGREALRTLRIAPSSATEDAGTLPPLEEPKVRAPAAAPPTTAPPPTTTTAPDKTTAPDEKKGSTTTTAPPKKASTTTTSAPAAATATSAPDRGG